MIDSMVHDIAIMISAIASLIAAMGSLLAVLTSLRNGRKIEVVRKESNGMRDELVKVASEKSFAEGVKQGETSPRADKLGS